VWPVLVAIVAPVGDHDLGFCQAGEQLNGEQVVTALESKLST
jgi:hypothetical protein